MVIRSARPKNPAYPKELKTLGDHVRNKRLDLGLLQQDVALKLGMSKATVANWEKGQTEPEIRALPAVLAFLGYDPRPAADTMAEKLVRFRATRGWTQHRLAAEIGVDPTTLARWERGEKEPWGDYAKKVERCLKS